MPLWPLNTEEEEAGLATVQEDADYTELERYQHGEDVLLFSSLSDLVHEQLAGRAERIAKHCLSVERASLGHEVASWRYTLSQDLKEKLLKTISDDFLIHMLEVTTRELQGAIQGTSGRLLQSGTRAQALHESHEDLISRHKDGRNVIGFLFRLPFDEDLLTQDDSTEQQNMIEVGFWNLCIGLVRVALPCKGTWLNVYLQLLFWCRLG